MDDPLRGGRWQLRLRQLRGCEGPGRGSMPPLLLLATEDTKRRSPLHCKHYAALQALHCTAITTLHCKPYTALQVLHCTASTTLHCKHYTELQALRWTTSTTLHCCTVTTSLLHCTTLHCNHSTALHSSPLLCTATTALHAAAPTALYCTDQLTTTNTTWILWYYI